VIGTGADLTGGGLAGGAATTLSVRGLTANGFSCGSVLILRRTIARVGGAAADCQFSAREAEFRGASGWYIGSSIGTDTSVIDRCKFEKLAIVTNDGKPLSLTLTNSIVAQLDLSALSPTAPTMIDAEYNTFYNDDVMPPVTCGSDAATPTGITFRNNIFNAPGARDTVTSGTAKCVFDTNLIYPQETSLGSGTLFQDPKFVNTSASDLHLSAMSPAIDASTTSAVAPSTDYDGTLRPQGAARDLGAFEYHQ
jgi:hypothetical protein